MPEFTIRSLLPSDKDFVKRIIISEWSAEFVVSHGEIFHPKDLPGYVACDNKIPVGLLTYYIKDNILEIVTLNSLREGIGIGTALINKVIQFAYQSRCERLFLVTTNNNTHALRFYQKRGFHISDIRINAIEKYRDLKPQIPTTDIDGLLIKDEIELEFPINNLVHQT